jgi:hypothetical protein
MYGNPYDLGGLGGPNGHDPPPNRYSGFTRDTISLEEKHVFFTSLCD